MNHPPIGALIDLKGKRAIVTGGAMGIGFAIASRFAEAGARVLIADKDAAAAEAAAGRLEGAVSSAVDVSHESEVVVMIEKAIQEFGGVDILVNNAGIYPFMPVMEATMGDFERVIHVNLMGAFFCSKGVAAQMALQGTGGKIIHIALIYARHPSWFGLAFYDASKHGLWGFTKNLALELAPHHICVNAIAPGAVATPGTGYFKNDGSRNDEFLKRIPMGRPADPDEIGRVALFLASDLSSYMTGSQIVVDGGFLIS